MKKVTPGVFSQFPKMHQVITLFISIVVFSEFEII